MAPPPPPHLVGDGRGVGVGGGSQGEIHFPSDNTPLSVPEMDSGSA